ncbi:MAG TPA: glycosyltransferase family 4 protein [Solirubrobacterales bacterium]|nr:glycosyltransferase family 4 protein [Solirubrobacterales bacterium]
MPERPRVLQMGPDPSIGGGMAAALRALLASPLADRYELEVVPTYRSRQPLRRLAVFGLALLRLASWSLRGRGRLVHVHATVRGSAYRKAVCVLLARALGRRVLLQVHSGPGDIAEFRRSLGRIRLALLRAGLAAADQVVAVSAASAETLKQAGVRGEVGVVPNPAPAVPPFERARAPEGRATIAYLGGFANPAKGGDVLLEALAALLPEEPRVRVVLAGPGELPARACELCERHPGLSWVGWLGPEAKDELLRAAEIFVMPSRSEGLPMALLEAMAYGMAVVATRVGGVPDVLEDGEEGLLVACEDSRALAVALGRIVADPQRRRSAGIAARRRAKLLDAEGVSNRLMAAYERRGA